MSQRDHVSSGDTAVLEEVALPVAASIPLSLLVFGEHANEARPLSGPLTVGRDAACGLKLDDPALSRVHAELIPDGGTLTVVDRGSKNGTFVDGRRIARAEARAGSLIRIGNTFLRVGRLTESWQRAAGDGPFVGGTALAAVRRLITLVGPTELPVLLLGETGTGKEVVARLLHAASARRGAFIPVNCAALPEPLVESELFGHVRGAFSGAQRAHKGLFSVASGGTLFLDEVGDLPLPAQVKLLRVLDDKMVRPVGGETAHKADVRILAATNRDLHRAVAEERFRADLLARLSTVELRLPPLRERVEDLPALAAFILARAGRTSARLAGDALESLALYDWPQNVRELDNVLRQAALAGTPEIALSDLPPRFLERLERARKPETAETGEAASMRERIEGSLRQHGGNIRQASLALGIGRGHFYRLVKRWNLDIAQFRGRDDSARR